MAGGARAGRVRIITIPSSDVAFRRMTDRIYSASDARDPRSLESRLRRVFPRAVVRSRDISGESPAWYVYRDGMWRSSGHAPWWQDGRLPRLVVNREGWVTEANPTALGLLGIGSTDLDTRHFTDFVAPGGLQDALALFEIVDEGHDLTATVRLRPTSGHVLAVDLHAQRDGETIVGVLRLADEVDLPVESSLPKRPAVACEPDTDAAFRSYVELALSRMPEATPDGLAIRLRRLYPHADVIDLGDHWLARREPASALDAPSEWWNDPSLPRVRYDAQALIVWCNEPAQALLGQSLVGHYWQEFVTPGSTEQVSAMLAILADLGRAESRFRMPRADGTLVEFDSYTEVHGESFTTVMRPRT